MKIAIYAKAWEYQGREGVSRFIGVDVGYAVLRLCKDVETISELTGVPLSRIKSLKDGEFIPCGELKIEVK